MKAYDEIVPVSREPIFGGAELNKFSLLDVHADILLTGIVNDLDILLTINRLQLRTSMSLHKIVSSLVPTKYPSNYRRTGMGLGMVGSDCEVTRYNCSRLFKFCNATIYNDCISLVKHSEDNFDRVFYDLALVILKS